MPTRSHGHRASAQALTYALVHLPHHLVGCGRHSTLVELLTRDDDWLTKKRHAGGNDVAYNSDLDLAARRLKDPLHTRDEVAALIRLAAARRIVREQVRDLEDDDLAVLAWMDRQQEALGGALLRQDPEKVCDGLMTIYRVLAKRGSPDIQLLRTLENHLDRVEPPRGRTYVASALAIEHLQIGDSHRATELLEKAVETLGQMKTTLYETIWARQVVAAAQARIQDPQTGLNTLDEIGDPFWKALGFIEILRQLPELVHHRDGRSLEACRDLIRSSNGPGQQVYASRYLVKALMSAGERTTAHEVFDGIPDFLRPGSERLASERTSALSWYEICRVDLGDFDRAPQVLADARHPELVRELVDALARQESYGSVEAALALIEDDDARRNVRRRLILSASEHGCPRRAQESFARYLEIRPPGDHGEANELVAKTVEALHRLGRPEMAACLQRSFGIALTRRPTDSPVDEAPLPDDAQVATALALQASGDRGAARAELERIDAASLPLESMEQLERRLRLGAAFGRCGHRDRAIEILTELREQQKWWLTDSVNRPSRAGKFSSAMAEAGAFVMALEVLAIQVSDSDPADYFNQLAAWAPHFERTVPGSGVLALEATASILGWVDPRFHRLRNVLRDCRMIHLASAPGCAP